MPLPEGAEVTSASGQVVGGILGFLSICAMVWQAIRPKKDETSTTRTMTETVTLDDDKPLTAMSAQAVGYLRRIADNTDVLVKSEQDRKAEEEKTKVLAAARVQLQEQDTLKRMNDSLERIAEAERVRNEQQRRDRGERPG